MGQVGLVGQADQGQNPEGTKDVATLEISAELLKTIYPSMPLRGMGKLRNFYLFLLKE